MILDLIWAGGEVLSIVALPSGGTVPELFGRRSSAPPPLLPRDVRLKGRFTIQKKAA